MGNGGVTPLEGVRKDSQWMGPCDRWFPGQFQEAGFCCGLDAAGPWSRFLNEYLTKSFLEGIHLF